jgi:HPt (histidine-containing phosphotransfer) domain-containing protein
MVLDREQLRDVTLEDEELMRQLLAVLIEDTQRHIPLLELAVRGLDAPQCARLAHYCKGACANLGAQAVAAVLECIERHAIHGSVEECAAQLVLLAVEVDRLRAETI